MTFAEVVETECRQRTKHLSVSAVLLLSTLSSAALAQNGATSAAPGQTAGASDHPSAATTELRTTTPLMQNWSFVQDDSLTDDEALASKKILRETISLPHTWNAESATP